MGFQDWLRENSSQGRRNNSRRTGGPGPQSGPFAVPMSEQRWTQGYNSPEHNWFVANSVNPATGRPVYTSSAYEGFINEYLSGGLGNGATTSNSAVPSYTGGGRGGGGGGGGGGGMTQAMLNAMMQVLGTRGQPLALSQVDLPDFQGQPLGPFNAQPYTQALGQINTAVTADQAASRAAGQQASQALQGNYTNAYANTPVMAAPAAPQVGGALQGTAGGGGDQAQVAATSDAGAASDQASFANLLKVLAANDQTSQASRMNQVALDQGTAARNINAQALGLRGGVNMAQSQARNQWQQQAAERQYQNSLMGQQWNREEMMRNQDITNQNTQANWQQRNEMISNRLGPLLELLMQGGKLDISALQQLLSGWTG